MIKAIRGAVNADANTKSAIFKATRKLIWAISKANSLRPKDVITIIFTMTDDLDDAFPALAARQINGWQNIPMLCARELAIKNSMRSVVRVLMLVESEKEPKHQYLGKTKSLRINKQK